MELVKEVAEGTRVASEKGDNGRRGRRKEKKQETALKEKRDIVILRWRKSPRLAASKYCKAKLLPAHHITLSSFRKSGAPRPVPAKVVCYDAVVARKLQPR